MELSKRARLEEAFRRLADAPDAMTADEMLAQFSNVLNEVENELTTIPHNPSSWASDGRLYPPQRDSVRQVAGHPNVTRYRSVRHNTVIGVNGSIEVSGTDGKVEFRKAGVDGRYVWDLILSRTCSSQPLIGAILTCSW